MAFFSSSYDIDDEPLGTTIATWRVPCAAQLSAAALSRALAGLKSWQATDGPLTVRRRSRRLGCTNRDARHPLNRAVFSLLSFFRLLFSG